MSGWKETLKKALEFPLPGEKAQELMAPTVRYTGNGVPDQSKARDSSVLILLYPHHQRLYIPFIQRPDYNGVHGGQISLPGGKCETFDNNKWETALRETHEELGIDTSDIEYMGVLTPLYIPNSNFIVHPYVGHLPRQPIFNPSPFEVKEVLEISIQTLFKEADSQNIVVKNINGHEIQAPCFESNGSKIWGATAMILSELNIVFRKHMPRWANALHSYNAHIAQVSP